jgi:hypothetical protein
MPIKTPKELFVMLLSDVRQGTEKAETIYEEIGQLVQDPEIKEALQAPHSTSASDFSASNPQNSVGGYRKRWLRTSAGSWRRSRGPSPDAFSRW